MNKGQSVKQGVNMQGTIFTVRSKKNSLAKERPVKEPSFRVSKS